MKIGAPPVGFGSAWGWWETLGNMVLRSWLEHATTRKEKYFHEVALLWKSFFGNVSAFVSVHFFVQRWLFWVARNFGSSLNPWADGSTGDD